MGANEQNNNKARLDNEIIAKEIGIARYQRINNFDWTAGKVYWENTEVFWKKVRDAWSQKLENSNMIC